MSHGHVVPNADGRRDRCGGPKICQKCAAELDGLKADSTVELKAIAEHGGVVVARLASIILELTKG